MLKVKCPAKINLTLEILNKRPDGFHNIQSVMQAISLFDYLTIDISTSEKSSIIMSGTSKDIPYNEKNLVYKACKIFLDKIKKEYKINIFIEKNIPIAAGLAGGSTDAAGTIFALNELLNKPFSKKELHNMCALLGSDINFCLEGGCKLTLGRGEKISELPFNEFDLSLIKPKNLGISAKEAYTKFSKLKNKPNLNMTDKFVNGDITVRQNDLETAIINDYEELLYIKKLYPNSMMSGSGSTFIVFSKNLDKKPNENYITFENLKSIPYGVCVENK